MRLIVWLVLVCAAASAQSERQGRWVPAKPSVKGIPKADAERLKEKGIILTELLGAAAAPFRDYDGIATVRISMDPQAGGPLRDVPSGVAEVTLRPLGKGESQVVTFRLNSLEAVLGRLYLTDDRGDMYIEPEHLDTIGGFPVYRPATQTSPVLVITRHNQPLFVLVTRERLIKARHAEAVRLAEQMASAGEAAAAAVAQAKQRVAALAAELAATPRAELAMPAEIGPSARVSGLADPGTQGTRRIVSIVPALLDPSLPISSIRVLTLEHSDAFGHNPELEALRRKVDLAKAVKIMD